MFKFLDFFKNSKGQIVIFQAPNLPLICWLILTILNLLWSNNQPKMHNFFNLLSFGFIFTWAWLEITSGVNYFRQALGVLVIIIAVVFNN
ncbi:hypothetical protein E3226_007070 [Legionella geestiana]|uniref:hypothetical protein n=1 Tax=Legionella geestiana TaxID=45065 RepID=UPI0010923766|nr:hypothetical protein [Legionella geestiana]QDQ40177.1 hypothetical protein E3226_007070 [Legionella geestiana]